MKRTSPCMFVEIQQICLPRLVLQNISKLLKEVLMLDYFKAKLVPKEDVVNYLL